MNSSLPLDRLTGRLAEIHGRHPDTAMASIDAFLKQELADQDHPAQLAILDELIRAAESGSALSDNAIRIDHRLLRQVCLKLLGKDLSTDTRDPAQMLNRLSDSINTVFDSLNQLINVINTTLSGQQERDETIRQVIGYHLEEDGRAAPLETHIGQITKAFIVSHQAFQQTILAKTMQIIDELRPETIKNECGAGKFAPWRKSAGFDCYEKKFNRFIQWVESGGFMESTLREFERRCRDIPWDTVQNTSKTNDMGSI